MTPRLKCQGLTLIEIMIVVAIMALLATGMIAGMLRARRGANHTVAQATLRSFGKACESFMAAQATYPTQLSDLTGGFPPYFSFNLTAAPKDGYSYTANFGGSGAGYTVTASALPNAGNWDYQVTTGVVLMRSEAGQDNWEHLE